MRSCRLMISLFLLHAGFAFVAASAGAQTVFDCVAPAAPALVNPTVLGDGSAGSVSTSELQDALNTAAAVRLNIGTSTLTLAQELVIDHAVILEANGATLSGGNARRVLHISNPNNLTYTFSLLNATIVNGATPTESGAGLWKPSVNEFWQVVSIRIFNSHFINNTVIAVAQDDGGGGIYVVGAKELTVVNSTFSGNHGANGGALYALGAQLVDVFDTQFSGNSATGNGGNPGNGGNGGAIGIDGDARNVNLCRVIVSNNTSNAFGAGFFTTSYNTSSFTRIQDSTFLGNRSVATDKLVGGAYLQGTTFSIRGSTFQNNMAAGYAGIALFDENVNGDVVHTTGDITNSTFVGNQAVHGLGGAMAIQATGAVTLENVTIAGNTSTCNGVCFAGGIANDPGSPITMRNTIFLNNTGDNAFNPWALLHPVSGSNNIQWPQVRPGSFGEQELPVTPGAIFADALLAPPANNGGLTQTMALPASSPAIDAGTSLGALPTDQRGDPRVGPIDIGAFEYQGDHIFANGFE
jgi:hypothetical protein